MRRLLAAMLQDDPAFELAGCSSAYGDCLWDVSAARPDLLVLDADMPEADGLQALAVLRRTAPETRVVVWSSRPAEAVGAHAYELGATAVVRKQAPFTEMRAALVAALREPSGQT